MGDRRRKAIIRRRIFIISALAVIVAAVLAIGGIVSLIKNALSETPPTDTGSESLPPVSSHESSSELPSSSEEPIVSSEPEIVDRGDYQLDANYSRLILVNGENPLPADYNYGWNLTTMESQYYNGFRTEIDAGIWPYTKAMCEAAWADGVELYVLSPYRSYETQKALFEAQVAREGGDEDAAATVVARPGTSEHNTGLCADFNMADEAFENTPMFAWLQKNAADYGFILRYPENKIDITGVIYEAWHWRFVGINVAKEINELGVTLEEYIQIKGLEPQADLYSFPTAE